MKTRNVFIGLVLVAFISATASAGVKNLYTFEDATFTDTANAYVENTGVTVTTPTANVAGTAPAYVADPLAIRGNVVHLFNTYGVPGNGGTQMDFPGNDADIALGSDFTVEWWAYGSYASTTSQDYIVANNYSITLTSNHNWQPGNISVGVDGGSANSSPRYDGTKWLHVVLVVRPDGTFTHYIQPGVLIANGDLADEEKIISGTFTPASLGTTTSLRLGTIVTNTDQNTYGHSTDVYLDDLAMWDTALSYGVLSGPGHKTPASNGNPWGLTTPSAEASLTIKKFFDCTNNGVKDYSDENLLPGWEYHITGPGGYDQTLTTDGAGQIALTGLDPGDYTITETVKQDHSITTGNQGVVIALGGGDDKTELFGNLLPGDINQDELVDSVDFTILKSNFGLSPKTWVQGNLNPLEDTAVDSIDFTILKAYYGKGVPPGPGGVPEPATLSLLALGACLPLLRRRR